VVRAARTTRYWASGAVAIILLTVASGFCPHLFAAQAPADAPRPRAVRDETRREEIARLFRDTKLAPAPLVTAESAWKLTLSAVPSAAAAMDEERVYLPLHGDLLIALDRETGLLAWNRSVDTASPPAIGGDALFLVSRGTIRSLDTATGEDRWSVPIDGNITAPLVCQTGWLFAILDSRDLLALRASDGEIVWRQRLGSVSSHPPVPYGSALYLSLANGNVVALDLATGKPLWQHKLPGMLSEPAVGKDRVFVGSDNNFFYALEAGSGHEVWKWRNGGDVIGAAVDGDAVYFASLDNVLRAVNRTNGNQRWRKPTGTRPLLPPRAFGGIVVLPGLMPAITVFVGETGVVMGTQMVQGQLVGPPLIDAGLKARHVAMITVTREGVVEALRPEALMFREGAVTPVAALPGRSLTRERIQ
jgi:outer membrane protein assembly factor BamB